MFVASPAVGEGVDLSLLSTKYDFHTIDKLFITNSYIHIIIQNKDRSSCITINSDFLVQKEATEILNEVWLMDHRYLLESLISFLSMSSSSLQLVKRSIKHWKHALPTGLQNFLLKNYKERCFVSLTSLCSCSDIVDVIGRPV